MNNLHIDRAAQPTATDRFRPRFAHIGRAERSGTHSISGAPVGLGPSQRNARMSAEPNLTLLFPTPLPLRSDWPHTDSQPPRVRSSSSECAAVHRGWVAGSGAWLSPLQRCTLSLSRHRSLSRCHFAVPGRPATIPPTYKTGGAATRRCITASGEQSVSGPMPSTSTRVVARSPVPPQA